MIQTLSYSANLSETKRVGASTGLRRIPVALILAAPCLGGTSAAHASPLSDYRTNQTHVSVEVIAREEEVSARDALAEIKAKAGLTWAQLAAIFGVSSKSVHNWMSGTGMSDANRHILSATLDKVRAMAGDRGYRIRNALLGSAVHSAPDGGEGALVVSDNTPLRHRPTKLVGSIKSG